MSKLYTVHWQDDDGHTIIPGELVVAADDKSAAVEICRQHVDGFRSEPITVRSVQEYVPPTIHRDVRGNQPHFSDTELVAKDKAV